MSTHASDPHRAARQEQFLHVIDCAEAHRRFEAHLSLAPLARESVPLADSLGRVLADDIVAHLDVPGFDRANVDGFAVQALDTSGASEQEPRELRLNSEVLAPGVVPREPVTHGTATTLATGAIVPRGADAVLMVEHSDLVEADGKTHLRVTRAVSPGEHISFTGTDIARGETALRAGQVITSREIGVLAAIGVVVVPVVLRPRVAILSTGDEIVAPGEPLPVGAVYDSNGAILAAAVQELGGEPVSLGITQDDEQALSARLNEALKCDLVLLSGGTSKGAGDLSYRVVSQLPNPGIVAHGVALKPGKPICLAVTNGKPVVILPGFPTSAIFTFHEFVAPVIRAWAGRPPPKVEHIPARLPIRINSERGRTEYLLVNLVRDGDSFAAYPMGKSSGSVTAFSTADGFITIDQQTELQEAGADVEVQLLGEHLQPADLVVIGSHCVGLDYLLSQLQRRGVAVKAMHIGSLGGLAAVKRGQCDLAGMHLMDPETGDYNVPYLTPELELIPGYGRLQGLVFRRHDSRFDGKSLADAVAAALLDPHCTMVNRNTGSGTRILIDQLLGEQRPPGYAVQAKSHNAVAAAVKQGRADWGVAIDTVARDYELGFIAMRAEQYDFVTPKSRADRLAVRMFRELLGEHETRERLQGMGFELG